MFFSCGLYSFNISFFHLINHAFFKALLFLSSGVIIHALGDEQDMRKLGGLGRLLPATYVMVCIGSLALVGFPFLTGFYSKDLILEFSFGNYMVFSTFAYGFGVLAAMCTAFYSFKFINLVFLVPNNNYRFFVKNISDGSFFILFPLVFLTFCSLYFGFIFKDLFVGLGTDAFGFSLSMHRDYMFEAELVSSYYKNIPLYFTVVGFFAAYYFKDSVLSFPFYYRSFFFFKKKTMCFFYYIVMFFFKK